MAPGVLPQNPYHGRLGFWFVERIQVVAQCADDRLVAIRVLAEDIANDLASEKIHSYHIYTRVLEGS